MMDDELIEKLKRRAGILMHRPLRMADNGDGTMSLRASDEPTPFEVSMGRFAALVAEHAIAAEREACAKVCDERAKENEGYTEEEHCAQELAAAIRARALASPAGEPRKY